MANEKIRVRTVGQTTKVTLMVDPGTKFESIAKLNLGRVIDKFRPKGCQACLSGLDFRIRENLIKELSVDLNKFM